MARFRFTPALRQARKIFCHKKKEIRIITSVYFVTFVIILPLILGHVPGTIYHKILNRNTTRLISILNKENSVRIADSEYYIFNEYLNQRQNEVSPHGRGVMQNQYSQNMFSNMVVMIITTSRSRRDVEPKYLTQVLGKLLRQTQEHGITVEVNICNVESNATTHTEALGLRNVARVISRYDSFVALANSSGNKFEKEKSDYVFCLRESLKSEKDYVLIIEDDALPRDDFVTILIHFVTRLKQRMDKSILFLKLYHPGRLLGYMGFERERISELIILSSFSTGALLLVVQKVLPAFFPHILRESSLATLICRKGPVVVIFLYFLLLFLAIGRQNVNELRRISRYLYQLTPAPSCCTPALLFPRHGAEIVADYLESVTCKLGYAIDSAIDKLVKTTSEDALLIQPSLFKHIGLYSTLRGRTTVVNPLYFE